MLKGRILFCLVLAGLTAALPLGAATPPAASDSGGFFSDPPVTAEVEVFSGGITGHSIGAGFRSINRGTYGVRFGFGFMKSLNFSLNYMYSNQTRTLVATTPPIGTLPTGTALMKVGNVNMFFGNGEFNFVRTRKAVFYLSPGVGFTRNGARSLTLVTPAGSLSSPILPGTAVTFNLGLGMKYYPRRHFGVRLDLRDFVSQGGTGSLQPKSNDAILQTATQYFGKMPVQNNIVLTLGFIFRIL